MESEAYSRSGERCKSPAGSLGTTSNPILGEEFELCLVEAVSFKEGLFINCLGEGRLPGCFALFLLFQKHLFLHTSNIYMYL